MKTEWRQLGSGEDWTAVKESLQGSSNLLLFKHSPICSISLLADEQLNLWLSTSTRPADLLLVRIDVISQRTLSRSIASEIDVNHQSPQLILLDSRLKMIWQLTHFKITREQIDEKFAK